MSTRYESMVSVGVVLEAAGQHRRPPDTAASAAANSGKAMAAEQFWAQQRTHLMRCIIPRRQSAALVLYMHAIASFVRAAAAHQPAPALLTHVAESP